MGLGDKISNKAQETTGKAKEGIGNATDNDRLRAEYRAVEPHRVRPRERAPGREDRAVVAPHRGAASR